MTTAPSSSQIRWGVPLALTGLVWLCFYRLSGGFGLYEDDLHFFASLINFDSFHDLTNWIKFCWSSWPQGRPAGYTAMYSLGFLADRAGGLVVFQLLGYALAVANTLLFHRLIARLVDWRAAMPATLFFGLAAIATVQPAFTFAFYYDVAALFMLSACNVYLTRWRPLAYLLLALAMLSQEPITIAFLFFPWLVLPWDRRGLRLWLVHAAIWTLVIGVILVARWKIGDPWGGERVAQLMGSPGETLLRSIRSVTLGSLTQLKLIFVRPYDAILHTTLPGLLAALAALPVLAWILRQPSTPSVAVAPHAEPNLPLWRMALVGLACMCLPYAAYFRDYWYPCSAETGFFSAVHVMTKFGGALLVGSAWGALSAWSPTRYFALPAAAVYFAAWILFGQQLQTDYVRNRDGQLEFWNAVYRLCPDLNDGIDVLVLDQELSKPRYMNQFTWADELTPGRIFKFPATWTRAPRAYLVNPDITGHHIQFADGTYTWISHPSILFHAAAQKEIIAPGTVIILRRTAAGYERVFGEFPVKGGTLPLKTIGPATLPSLSRRAFARYFTLPPATPIPAIP